MWDTLKILLGFLLGPVIVVTSIIILLLLALESTGGSYNG